MKTTIDPNRLLTCRKGLGLTQKEAAALIGITQPAYQRYEAGTRSPSVQVLKEMARVFKTSESYLTGASDQKKMDYITIGSTESPLLFSVVDSCRNCSDEQLKRLMAYLAMLTK